MRVIYKYLAFPGGATTCPMTVDRKWLHVEEQHRMVTCWAMIETDAAPESVNLLIAATGQALGDEFGRYVGTCLVSDGNLVWHVFEQSRSDEQIEQRRVDHELGR